MDAEIFMAANLLFSTVHKLNEHTNSPPQGAAVSSNYMDYASSSSSSPSPTSLVFQRPKQSRKRPFRETLISLESSDSDNVRSDGGDDDGDWGKNSSKHKSNKVRKGGVRKPVQRRKRKPGSPGSTATDGESGGVNSASSTAGTLVSGRVCSFCAATVTPMWRHGKPGEVT